MRGRYGIIKGRILFFGIFLTMEQIPSMILPDILIISFLILYIFLLEMSRKTPHPTQIPKNPSWARSKCFNQIRFHEFSPYSVNIFHPCLGHADPRLVEHGIAIVGVGMLQPPRAVILFSGATVLKPRWAQRRGYFISASDGTTEAPLFR